MRKNILSNKAPWWIIALPLAAILACVTTQTTPTAQIVEVTREVPITQIVTVEVVPKVIEVTRLVPVTQIVVVEVEVPTVITVSVPGESLPQVALPVWYDFEGDFLTSGMVVDRTGNGQDVQVVGSVSTAPGIAGGQAVSFSGDGYLLAKTNPAAGVSAVSFSLWFKTDQPQENYKLASAAWWNRGPASGWILATHIPEFWSDDQNSLYLPDLPNQDNGFLPGEWNHEVVTYDGQHIREYTNGQLVNDWLATALPIGQGQPMTVGAWPQYEAYNFVGQIDEFRLFDRALNLEEIQALYQQR